MRRWCIPPARANFLLPFIWQGRIRKRNFCGFRRVAVLSEPGKWDMEDGLFDGSIQRERMHVQPHTDLNGLDKDEGQPQQRQ